MFHLENFFYFLSFISLESTVVEESKQISKDSSLRAKILMLELLSCILFYMIKLLMLVILMLSGVPIMLFIIFSLS